MNTQSRRNLGAILFATALLLGCSTSAKVANMVPVMEGPFARHDVSISVSVTGGHGSSISSENFAASIVETVERYGIFNSASQGRQADYQLIVLIVSMPQSFLSYNLQMQTRWILQDASGAEIWTEEIQSTGHSHDFGGAARARKAAERAASANIELGVRALSEVSL